jgi:hypothetical protein
MQLTPTQFHHPGMGSTLTVKDYQSLIPSSNKLESVEHNTCIMLKCDQVWLHVSALQEAIIRPFVGEQLFKYKTYGTLAYYGVPCSFTKLL